MPYLRGISQAINPYLYARAVQPILSSWIAEGWVDVLDAHFSWPDGVAAAILARRLRLPYTITLRGVLKRYASHLTSRRPVIRALRDADAIMAVSQSLKKDAVDLGIPSDRITVVPNGVDTSIFSTRDQRDARRMLGRSGDETMLITVGHLCRRKGVHRVLRMLPELIRHDDTIRYVVVGDDGAEGRFGTYLQRLSARLGLADRVTFTGALSPQRVAAWLQAADLFVLSTKNEGCCNALCEAQATGLPVVATDVGGNREIVAPTGGAIVPFGDGPAFIRAIHSALANRPTAQRISLMNRTWEQVAEDTIAVLQAACSDQKNVHVGPEAKPIPPTSEPRPSGRNLRRLPPSTSARTAS